MRTPLFPWFILWVTIPIIIFFLFILPAHASDGQFYQRGQEGWFWYQVIPEPAEDEEPIKPESGAAESSQSGLKPFSAAWFREHMQSFMDKAIDEPTTENVRAYLYLQRVMMDKGSLFADVSQQVVMGDPVLDEISRRPLATYAANRMDREAGAQRDIALGEVAKRAGLFFFYRSDCPYCHAQAPIIESMALNYGFEVFAIAVDGLPLPGGEFPNYKVDSGQAQSLSVTTVPAVFLVDPPNVITPIGQGAMSLDELNNRIILAAHQAGWIDDQTYYATRPVQPGVSLAMSAKSLTKRYYRTLSSLFAICVHKEGYNNEKSIPSIANRLCDWFFVYEPSKLATGDESVVWFNDQQHCAWCIRESAAWRYIWRKCCCS